MLSCNSISTELIQLFIKYNFLFKDDLYCFIIVHIAAVVFSLRSLDYRYSQDNTFSTCGYGNDESFTLLQKRIR